MDGPPQDLIEGGSLQAHGQDDLQGYRILSSTIE
jgi:hypothetical protein